MKTRIQNKTKKALLPLLLLIAVEAAGQSTGVLQRIPCNGIANEIRRMPDAMGRYILHSYSSVPENHFAFTNLTMMKDVTIPNSNTIHISDFEIIDHTVFFCGDNWLNGSGLFGWFDIDSVFFLGGGVHMDQTLRAIGLTTLENIEVYKEPDGRIHVAGYGRNLNGTYKFSAFEAMGYPTSTMLYRTLELSETSNLTDITDMTVTDNFVVYLGRDRSQECYDYYGLGVFLHPFKKYQMFDNPPFNVYYYETVTRNITNTYPGVTVSDNEDPHHSASPKIVHIDGDTVAVCSYRRDFEYYINNDPPPACTTHNVPQQSSYLVLRRFDVTPELTNNPPVMLSANGYWINNEDVISIDGLEYDTLDRKFIVLHKHFTSATVPEHAVTTFDYSTGVITGYTCSEFQTAFNTSTTWYPTSLCLNWNHDYVVSGYNNSTREYMLWHNQYNSPSQCNSLLFNKVGYFPTKESKNNINRFTPTGWAVFKFLYSDLEPIVYMNERLCPQVSE